MDNMKHLLSAGDYYIFSGKFQYTVKKFENFLDNGEREYSDPTYHTTLISALEELNERIKKDKFTKCKDIKDIITQQKAINKQFLKDMKKYENSKNA